MKILHEFYQQDAVTLAPQLLGKSLCRCIDGETIKLRITETESYMSYDTACHAHRGKTLRNSVMFEQGGLAYVYLCYGMHNLLNIVGGKVGDPQAVLICGAEGYPGPGRLTKALQIDRNLNGTDLTRDLLWLEDNGMAISHKTTPRIGIDYADEADRLRKWRFIAT